MIYTSFINQMNFYVNKIRQILKRFKTVIKGIYF